MRNPRTATIDHVSFGIADFDPDKVHDALIARGLSASVDTGAVATSSDVEKDIHTAQYKSYHTVTPNGFNLQISNRTTEKKIILG